MDLGHYSLAQSFVRFYAIEKRQPLSRQCLHQIGAADNADKPFLLHHWHSLDAMLFKEIGYLLQWCIWINGDNLMRHHIFGLRPMRPSRALTLSARCNSAREVTF